MAFQVAAERFNDHGLKVEYMVTLEAPLRQMMFAARPDQKTSMVDAALLAVLRNSKGELLKNLAKTSLCKSLSTRLTHIKREIWFKPFQWNFLPGSMSWKPR